MDEKVLEAINKAVKHVCLLVSGSKERWQILVENGASDDQILERAANEFGLGGGVTFGGKEEDVFGNIWASGGESSLNVHLHFYKPEEKDLIIGGKILIQTIRYVFEIPNEDKTSQLSLF